MSDPAQTANAGNATPEAAGGSGTGTAVTALGALFLALAASSCCVAPFVLVTVGISGAWIGNLTALAPYQPYVAPVALAAIAAGFWLVYRRPAVACAEGSYCAQPVTSRIAKIGVWMAAGVFGMALAFPFLLPLFVE